MRTPHVSVVIANFNRERLVVKCIQSLLQQTYQSIEIIVVDNGSNDDSVSTITFRFPSVRVIQNNQNVGFAAANSQGIRHASGEYILLLNNDTWVENDFVAAMVDAIKDEQADVLTAREVSYEKGADNPPTTVTIDYLGHYVKLKGIVPKRTFYLQGFCLFFKKDLYQSTGGFDSNIFMYFEDLDWCWRLNLMGKKLKYVSHLIVHHKKLDQLPQVSTRTLRYRNINQLRVILKNYSWQMLLVVLPAYIIINIAEMMMWLVSLKPSFARTYVSAWMHIARSWRNILVAHKEVQSQRINSDFAVMQKMYRGLGLLKHFRDFLYAHK